ncbi:hypothetical protein [Nocardia sp. NPDC005366]|uniref:hypothetical protein n=1 Tax=Nocardia sp. NPDC005366 TaxID=3156878 RepID=UPI0033A2E2C7
MALDINDQIISSDVTPEIARYISTAKGGNWFLSWLPYTPLTREQAISGMVLDETLSDPELTDTAVALEIAAQRAEDLGTDLMDVIVRLYTRIIERDNATPRPLSATAP